MSMQLSVHGRLGKAPRQIPTKTGTVMASASMAVQIPLSRGDDSDTQWFDILAFGRVAESLLSARTTRPGKRKASNQSAPQPEFDDALNF